MYPPASGDVARVRESITGLTLQVNPFVVSLASEDSVDGLNLGDGFLKAVNLVL